MSVNEKMTAIASAIREKGSIDHPLTLDEMAQSISRVYDNGHERGYMEGFSSGEEEGLKRGEAWGAKAEYDRFWDAYQQNGNRDNYTNAFYSWDKESFNPKYTISGTNMQGMFLYATIEEINVDIDARNTTNMNSCFNRCTNLRKIKKIIAGENTVFHVAMFSYSTALYEVIFEGTIAMDLALNSAKISAESAKSIIACLKNYKGTDSEYVHSIKLHANTWAALEADSTAPDGGTWANYVDSLGWLT